MSDKKFKVGSRFKISMGGDVPYEYILALVGVDKFMLINVDSGFRWSDAVTFRNIPPHEYIFEDLREMFIPDEVRAVERQIVVYLLEDGGQTLIYRGHDV
jgi:hypothetical protein